MTNAERSMLDALKLAFHTVDPAQKLSISSEESERMLDASIENAVLGMTYPAVPAPSEQYTRIAMLGACRSLQVLSSHAVIETAMEKAGIPHCFIKGLASARYYPVPDRRSMGDVDLLVLPEDMERAGKVLESLGFTADEMYHEFHIEYHAEESTVELHRSISSSSENNIDLAELSAQIVREAEQVKTPYGTVTVPNPYHHATVMLFHVYRHFLFSGIGLRHLCDWAAFLNSEDYDTVAERLWASCREWGLFRFATCLSLAAGKCCGIARKATVAELDESVVDGFIEDVLATGNFGRKTERSWQKHFSDKSLSGGKSLAGNFYQALAPAIYRRWPSAKEHKWLFALCIVIFPFRYGYEIITGKKAKPQLANSIQNAKQRNALIKALAD